MLSYSMKKNSPLARSDQRSESVHRVVVRSEDSGWAVLEVQGDAESMTLVGSLAHVDEGLRIEATGSGPR